MPDTIAGVATAVGEGGIAIVRISGDRAIDLFSAVFRASKHKPPYPDHLLKHGTIAGADGETIDEAMGVVMRAPSTYTREDVCELHTHGGYAAASLVMNLLMERGARPAEAGEFTRRAFMNGRIDLAQAEAVMGIIGRAFPGRTQEPGGAIVRRHEPLYQRRAGKAYSIDRRRRGVYRLSRRDRRG